MQAASLAGFAVGWIQYRNVNAGIKQCASKTGDGFCFKEDEVREQSRTDHSDEVDT